MKNGSSSEDDLGTRTRITIRELQIDDLASVYHLGERLFTKQALPALYRTWDPYEVTYFYNTDPNLCLVAENGKRELVGFALGTTIEKGGAAWRYGYLAWLGVAPEHQRDKVATSLLREFEKLMREEGARMLLVDTEGDNARALAFFKSLGFNNSTAHVWLSKSLSRRSPPVIKPVGALSPTNRRRRAAAVNGNGNGHSHATIGALTALTELKG